MSLVGEGQSRHVVFSLFSSRNLYYIPTSSVNLWQELMLLPLGGEQMKKMRMERRMRDRSAVSHLIIIVASIAVILSMVAALYIVATWPAVELTRTPSSGQVIVTTNSPTDLKNLKFSVDGTATTGTLDTVKSLTVKGLTVTFIDVGQDGKLQSGDYFSVEGSWAGSDPAMVLALLRVDGGAAGTIASVTLEPPDLFP